MTDKLATLTEKREKALYEIAALEEEERIVRQKIAGRRAYIAGIEEAMELFGDETPPAPVADPPPQRGTPQRALLARLAEGPLAEADVPEDWQRPLRRLLKRGEVVQGLGVYRLPAPPAAKDEAAE